MVKEMIVLLLFVALMGVADADYRVGPFCPAIGLTTCELPDFEIHGESWTVYYDINNVEPSRDDQPAFKIWVYDASTGDQIDYLEWLNLRAGEVPYIGPYQNSNYNGPGKYKIKIQMPSYFEVCIDINDHHSS